MKPIRLKGEAMKKLRRDCYERDEMTCQECGIWTFYDARWPGDERAYDMAHIKSRGAGGDDKLSNLRVLCHGCHMKEHAYGKSLRKPVPPKEAA